MKQDPEIDIQEIVVSDIPIDRIRPFANQPRKEFDSEELVGLANSIEEIGLQQPVPVKRLHGNIDYDFELVDGERRFRACRMIHLVNIRAFILPEMSADQQFAFSVAANFCRVGHTPMETAMALQIMVDNFVKQGSSREEAIEKASKICGRSSAWGAQHLSLLRLCPEVQRFLSNKKISFQIGIALTGIKEDFQIKFARHIISTELDQRKALSYIRNQRTPEIVSNHGRNRRPSDDYAIFRRTIEKMANEFDDLLGMSMKKVMGMFENRPSGDFEAIVSSLKDLSKQADLFARNLESAKK